MGRRFEGLDWYRSKSADPVGSSQGPDLNLEPTLIGQEGRCQVLLTSVTENDEVRVTRHSSSLRISSQQISFPAKSACTAGATTDSQYLG